MKVVLQRVTYGSVTVNSEIVGEINKGLVLLIGIGKEDTQTQANFLAEKILNLRVFEDEDGKMNLSALDIKSEILAISQFTLYGDTKKGRRPSFIEAAPPEKAQNLYEYFVDLLKKSSLKIETGIFKADMKVQINNDGPVTFIIEN